MDSPFGYPCRISEGLLSGSEKVKSEATAARHGRDFSSVVGFQLVKQKLGEKEKDGQDERGQREGGNNALTDVENEAIQKALAEDGGNEQAKALWGSDRFEQQDYERALQAFRGLSLKSVESRLQTTVELFRSSKRVQMKAENEGLTLSAHHAAVLLNAFLCQAKCLDKLGLPKEGAGVCRDVVKTIEGVFPHGFSHPPVSDWANKEFTELIAKAVVTLPRLHRKAGDFNRAVHAYRRALVSSISLSPSLKADVQKELAMGLVYGGFEVPPPLDNIELLSFNGWQSSSGTVAGGDVFTPANNIEEAVLLLMLLQNDAWSQLNMEHLCFTLSTSMQFEVLANIFEETKPGVYSRSERWYSMALSHLGQGNKDQALNVIRKATREHPHDVPILLLAGKLCSHDVSLACEGLEWAEKAVTNAVRDYECLRGKAYHVLGVVLGMRARSVLSDTERQRLQACALEALHESAAHELGDADVVYDLARQYAEMRHILPALQFARAALEWSNGAHIKAWRLVALLLSAQQRWEDAIEVCLAGTDAATSKCEEGLLLRTMAKIQVASQQYKIALDTYKKLLAVVQTQGAKKQPSEATESPAANRRTGLAAQDPLLRENPGRGSTLFSFEDGEERGVTEAEVWADLTEVYIALRQWDDAFTCVDHPCLSRYKPEHWYVNGLLEEAQEGDNKEEALASYENALAMNPLHVPSMIRMGVLHCQAGGACRPLARSFLTDALHEDPTDHVAWHTLGLVHKQEGRMVEAADCFSAALRMQLTAPAMSFSTLPKGL